MTQLPTGYHNITTHVVPRCLLKAASADQEYLFKVNAFCPCSKIHPTQSHPANVLIGEIMNISQYSYNILQPKGSNNYYILI